MNIQDILQKGGTKLDMNLDSSELYDYELVELALGKVDCVLDYSEYYDFELVEIVLGKIDAVLDYSEFYDYVLGDNTRDYIYREIFVTEGNYLITQDHYVLITQDHYYILYH